MEVVRSFCHPSLASESSHHWTHCLRYLVSYIWLHVVQMEGLFGGPSLLVTYGFPNPCAKNTPKI